jgi:hypothetical protein
LVAARVGDAYQLWVSPTSPLNLRGISISG